MGSWVVDLVCPSCGKTHKDLGTNKCNRTWVNGQEIEKFVVCPETKKTIYLGHERGKVVGFIKEDK